MIFLHRWRDRWANFNPFVRFLLMVLVLGLLALLAVLASKPALPIYRQWRAGQQLEAAAEALHQQRPTEARELALKVLRSDTSRKSALVILLEATDSLGDSRRSEVAHALLADLDYSATERMRAWQVICRSSAMARVLGAWTHLLPEQKQDPAWVSHLVERMRTEGMTADAGRLLSEQQPLSPPMELLLMKVLLDRKTDEAYREFQIFLIGKLADRSEHAGELSTLLDEIPQENFLPGVFNAYSEWLRDHPTDELEADLRLVRCEMAATKERAEEIFASTLAQFSESHPLPSARWCLQARHPAEAETLLKSVPQGPAVFELRRAALEELGDLTHWAALLSNPPAESFLPIIYGDLAHIAELQDDDKARSAAESNALRTAIESTADDSLIRLARHAHFRGMEAFSIRIWSEAIRLRTGPLPLAASVKSVIEKLASESKEPELLEVLANYRWIEPSNPVIVVQHSYLACLNGHITPDLLIRDLTPIYEQLPDALPVRCVLALAHLLINQPSEALRLTDGDQFDWFAATPPYRAIRAIALTSAGSNEQSAALLVDFPWDDLLRSERRILRGLLETADK